MLIKNGAKVNAVNSSGNTSLIRASREGHLEVVEELLKHREVDLSVVNKEGQTAVNVARLNGRLDIVACLMASRFSGYSEKL